MSSGENEALLVRKELVVEADVATSFAVFTQRIGRWWPLASHHIGAKPAETSIIEPFVGGRWFERSMDGTECMWGRVLAWEPPQRLLLSWQITQGWQFDETLETEVEVRFVAEGVERTRLILEHRRLENYGDAGPLMRGIFDSENGWSAILSAYVAATKAA